MRQIFAQGEKACRRHPLGGPREDQRADDVRREIRQPQLCRQGVPLDAKPLRHRIDGLVTTRYQGIADGVGITQEGDHLSIGLLGHAAPDDQPDAFPCAAQLGVDDQLDGAGLADCISRPEESSRPPPA